MENKKLDIAILLYNLRSVYNTASIFRTADCANILKMYLTGTTPEPHNKLGELRRDFIKVSLGAEKNIAYKKIKNLRGVLKLIKELKNQNYKILSIEQNLKSVPYYQTNKYLNKKDKLLLIVGSETKGIPQKILNLSDYILEIPIKGKLVKDKHHPRQTKAGKESLNVAIALAIVLFKILYN